MARGGNGAKKATDESSAITEEDRRTIGMEDAKVAGNKVSSCHWTKILVTSSEPEDIAKSQWRLAEEIMGKAATKPMKI